MVVGYSSDISRNLADIKAHIRQIAEISGRSPDAITLVAVSKTRSLDEVRTAIAANQSNFGENTIQDALTKIPYVDVTDAVWHFIGHLQSKKAKQVPGHFHWIHSIDSLKLAQKLSDAMVRYDAGSILNCLIQVNVSEEETKSGLKADQVLSFIEQLLKLNLPGLSWRGLMTIGVQGDENQTRAAFRALNSLHERCRCEFGLDNFDQLSMGMSNDYPIAIEEGATMVRIGTAIFGPRDVRI